MAFLEEVLDWSQAWLNQAAATLLNPVALAAGVALTVNHLEHEGLKTFFLVKGIFPFRLVPPKLVMR